MDIVTLDKLLLLLVLKAVFNLSLKEQQLPPQHFGRMDIMINDSMC